MKIKINLGKNQINEVISLDVTEGKSTLVLLAGETGSGKSIFHAQLYKQLLETYSPNQLRILLLDMTRVDYPDFQNYSQYFLQTPIFEPEKALETLEILAKENIDKEKLIAVHIEECDMAVYNQKRFEKAVEALKSKNNFLVVFSTSRIDPVFLTNLLPQFDLKIIFRTATPKDSTFLLGNETAFKLNQPGERIIAYQNKQTYCQPFTEEKINGTQDFLKIRKEETRT